MCYDINYNDACGCRQHFVLISSSLAGWLYLYASVNGMGVRKGHAWSGSVIVRTNWLANYPTWRPLALQPHVFHSL